MAAFQFPNPSVQQTVVNPITGSTYQWKEPPGKWVVTVSVRKVEDIVYEGDNPPIPRGDYKLWYSTDTLELYFWYEDENGNGAWVPTSAPITMLDDLDTAVAELRTDIQRVNSATSENQNRIGRTIYFSDVAPTIFPDDEIADIKVDKDGNLVPQLDASGNQIYIITPSELNYKFWYDTARLELLILFRDEDGDDSYVPVSIPLESLPEPGVSTETFTYTTGRLQTAIEENYLHNLAQDTAIDELKEQINSLTEIVKGSTARYTVKNTIGTPVSRPGEFSANTGFYANINTMSFGTADADGNPTKTMVNGNIIETYDSEENQANRYSITDASGAPTVVGVKYISGKLTYVRENELEVNIY